MNCGAADFFNLALGRTAVWLLKARYHASSRCAGSWPGMVCVDFKLCGIFKQARSGVVHAHSFFAAGDLCVHMIWQCLQLLETCHNGRRASDLAPPRACHGPSGSISAQLGMLRMRPARRRRGPQHLAQCSGRAELIEIRAALNALRLRTCLGRGNVAGWAPADRFR